MNKQEFIEKQSNKAWKLGWRFGINHRFAEVNSTEEMHEAAEACGCPYQYFDVFKYGAQAVWRGRGEIK